MPESFLMTVKNVIKVKSKLLLRAWDGGTHTLSHATSHSRPYKTPPSAPATASTGGGHVTLAPHDGPSRGHDLSDGNDRGRGPRATDRNYRNQMPCSDSYPQLPNCHIPSNTLLSSLSMSTSGLFRPCSSSIHHLSAAPA